MGPVSLGGVGPAAPQDPEYHTCAHLPPDQDAAPLLSQGTRVGVSVPLPDGGRFGRQEQPGFTEGRVPGSYFLNGFA